GCGGLRHVEGAVEMHLDDGIPVDHAHAMEDAVAQDAGIVDHAVDAAEGVDRRLDDALGPLRIGDAVAVGDGVAPGAAHLARPLIGNAAIGPFSVGGAAEIIDDDARTLGGGQQGDLPAYAAARSGDDDYFSGNRRIGHAILPALPRAAPPRVEPLLRY